MKSLKSLSNYFTSMNLIPFRHLSSQEKLRAVVIIISMIVIMIGSTALLGWAFNLSPLKQVHYGWVSVKVNAAIGLVLCGVTLLLQSLRNSRA